MGHKVAGGVKAQLGSPRTGRSHSLSGTHSSSDSRDTHGIKAAAPGAGWKCVGLAQQVRHTPRTQARGRTGISLRHALPLCGTDYVLHSPDLLQGQTANRKAKIHQKELFSGFWGEKSLLCWFLSPNHSLKSNSQDPRAETGQQAAAQTFQMWMGALAKWPLQREAAGTTWDLTIVPKQAAAAQSRGPGPDHRSEVCTHI